MHNNYVSLKKKKKSERTSLISSQSVISYVVLKDMKFKVSGGFCIINRWN